MRNVIFAINTTLDAFCDHTKFNPEEETMAYFTTSHEMLTHSSTGVKPIN